MNIGDAADRTPATGKNHQILRGYRPRFPARDANGYRSFASNDLHKLSFLGRARSLGFSIEDCRGLLALYEDHTRTSSDVKTIASEHLVRIDEKIAELQELRATLGALVEACAGDDRPDWSDPE